MPTERAIGVPICTPDRRAASANSGHETADYSPTERKITHAMRSPAADPSFRRSNARIQAGGPFRASRGKGCPMSPYVERFVQRLRDAEDDLKHEMDEQQRRWQYRVHRGRIWFEKELRENHRRLRQSIPAYILQGNVCSLLTAPITYSLLLPLAILDLWVTLYQWVCFPIYGMARVQRRGYFTIDRHKLAYLNGIEKVNCTFCSYANGLIAYAREVAARTEQYWCPIEHARAIAAPHQRYHVFVDYGDATGYRHGLIALRKDLRSTRRGASGDDEARDDDAAVATFFGKLGAAPGMASLTKPSVAVRITPQAGTTLPAANVRPVLEADPRESYTGRGRRYST
jgi:hypothetical protein